MEFLFFVETHPSFMYASYFVVAVFCQSTSRQSPNAKIILPIHLFFLKFKLKTQVHLIKISSKVDCTWNETVLT